MDPQVEEIQLKSLALKSAPFKETPVDTGFLNKIKDLKEKAEILEKEEEMKWDDKKKKLEEKGYLNGLNSAQSNSAPKIERKRAISGLNTPEIKTYKTIEFNGNSYEVDITGLTKRQAKNKIYYFKKKLSKK